MVTQTHVCYADQSRRRFCFCYMPFKKDRFLHLVVFLVNILSMLVNIRTYLPTKNKLNSYINIHFGQISICLPYIYQMCLFGLDSDWSWHSKHICECLTSSFFLLLFLFCYSKSVLDIIYIAVVIDPFLGPCFCLLIADRLPKDCLLLALSIADRLGP